MSEQQIVGRAAFLGGLLAFVVLVEFSVIGIGHARTLEGAANTQYWVVVALVAATAGFVTFSLAQTRAATGLGEAARKIAVPLSALGVALFLWETAALGTGLGRGPFELVGL